MRDSNESIETGNYYGSQMQEQQMYQQHHGAGQQQYMGQGQYSQVQNAQMQVPQHAYYHPQQQAGHNIGGGGGQQKQSYAPHGHYQQPIQHPPQHQPPQQYEYNVAPQLPKKIGLSVANRESAKGLNQQHVHNYPMRPPPPQEKKHNISYEIMGRAREIDIHSKKQTDKVHVFNM